MSATGYKASVRYRVGGYTVAALVLVDLSPETPASDGGEGIVRAIQRLDVARFVQGRPGPEGLTIAIELKLNSAYHDFSGVMKVATAICNAAGIEMVGQPKVIRSKHRQ